jgi:hypothetical protein
VRCDGVRGVRGGEASVVMEGEVKRVCLVVL